MLDPALALVVLDLRPRVGVSSSSVSGELFALTGKPLSILSPTCNPCPSVSWNYTYLQTVKCIQVKTNWEAFLLLCNYLIDWKAF